MTSVKGRSSAPPSCALAKKRSGSRMASMVASGTRTAALSAGLRPGSRARASSTVSSRVGMSQAAQPVRNLGVVHVLVGEGDEQPAVLLERPGRDPAQDAVLGDALDGRLRVVDRIGRRSAGAWRPVVEVSSPRSSRVTPALAGPGRARAPRCRPHRPPPCAVSIFPSRFIGLLLFGQYGPAPAAGGRSAVHSGPVGPPARASCRSRTAVGAGSRSPPRARTWRSAGDQHRPLAEVQDLVGDAAQQQRGHPRPWEPITMRPALRSSARLVRILAIPPYWALRSSTRALIPASSMSATYCLASSIVGRSAS